MCIIQMFQKGFCRRNQKKEKNNNINVIILKEMSTEIKKK